MSLPRIAVTMGDPAGVGPEVCLHLLADEAITQECIPVVFGDALILRRVAESAKLPLPFGAGHKTAVVTLDQCPPNWGQILDQPCIIHLPVAAADTIEPGKVSAATG